MRRLLPYALLESAPYVRLRFETGQPARVHIYVGDSGVEPFWELATQCAAILYGLTGTLRTGPLRVEAIPPARPGCEAEYWVRWLYSLAWRDDHPTSLRADRSGYIEGLLSDRDLAWHSKLSPDLWESSIKALELILEVLGVDPVPTTAPPPPAAESEAAPVPEGKVEPPAAAPPDPPTPEAAPVAEIEPQAAPHTPVLADETAIVAELRKLRRPTQAALVEFMANRKDATFEDVAHEVHSDSNAADSTIRKRVSETNKSLTELRSRVRFHTASNSVHKSTSPE